MEIVVVIENSVPTEFEAALSTSACTVAFCNNQETPFMFRAYNTKTMNNEG
jgi:hypothetical protein